MKQIVKLTEITKIYESKVMKRALNRLSFNAEEGEFIAIMGPSGSGKTTLLNMISTVDMPTYGEILIDGIEPAKLSKNELALFRRRHLGFVFQEINLLNMLTVEENIVLPLTLDGMSVEEMEKRVGELICKLELKELLNKLPDELSGGKHKEQQLVGRLFIDQNSF